MNPQTYIFIGKSGCGKGTQSLLLKQYLEKKSDRTIFYLESGERFREFISQTNHTAALSRVIMKRGELQPAFLAIHIWSHIMIEQMNDAKHVIIDGTPRKLAEAEILDGALRFYNRLPPQPGAKVIIIFMNVSDKWAIERLSGRGRADDKLVNEVVKRLAWFETDVMPAVVYYKNNPEYDFLEINGEQTIEEVHQEILSKI